MRSLYGVLLFLTLAQAGTQWRRFFCSERWGGYAEASRWTDRIENPRIAPFVLFVWMLCALLLAFGVWPVWAALINLILARYFFIHMRWKGVLRGMGAPGFMTYWLGLVVFLLELTTAFAPRVRLLVVLVAQVDFAFIMLSAGIYKATAGYARNHGMEYGMVNPEWGYWWRFFRRMAPGHVLFPIYNHLAWGTEVAAGVMMLVPATRFLGGFLILVSFVFILLQIRLGFLCEMVVVATFPFFHDGSLGAVAVARLPHVPLDQFGPDLPVLAAVIVAALSFYLLALPLAHAGLFYNFYGRKRFPTLMQRLLERYTNAFGLIIWRVFSVDVVNFFINVHRQDASGSRKLVSRYGWRGGFRYSHVGESIAVTSLFTTLKYYPGNSEIFRDRLLRYARTIKCGDRECLVFEYVRIVKGAACFEFRTAAEYLVDPRSGSLEERILDPSFSVRAPHRVSPVHEGARPGSYAPLSA